MEKSNTLYGPSRRRALPTSKAKHILIGFIAATIIWNTLGTRWLNLSFWNTKAIVKAERPSAFSADPADQWRDNVWPLRPSERWDISTDFAYPRSLEYDVTEGTWLRLDVHPITGEIVFDMIGDIYCLPSSTKDFQHAHPILLGVPHDSDPHFSPNGDRLVFRSDAGLGVENIWVIPWKGCSAMSLRPTDRNPGAASLSSELHRSLSLQKEDEAILASGVAETVERKTRRLLREGRLNAQRVTNETYRWVSEPRFHPSGEKIIATKWYFTTRSLGGGEGWEYPVPSVEEIESSSTPQISPGAGKRLVGRTLPQGWSPEEYGEQQIGPEQFIWGSNTTLIYAKNVVDESGGTFAYSGDVHSGIYAIFSRNLTSGVQNVLVGSSTGGASRPQVSRDGKTLAFVRRVLDHEALVLKDLASGTITHVWDGLTYDLQAIFAPMGTYPSFAFTPSDDAIIIWAAGHIYSVPLKVDFRGERVGAGPPKRLNFQARIEKRLANTLKAEVNLTALETAPTQRLHAFQELQVNHDGSKVTFNAAGVTYVQTIGEAKPLRVATLDSTTPYYYPSFIPDTPDFVVHSRWSDQNLTTFEIADLESGVAHDVSIGLPWGRYLAPTISGGKSEARKIAFVRTAGDLLTGNVVATSGVGLYLADIKLPESGDKSTEIELKDLKHIPSEIYPGIPLKLRFLDSDKLLVQDDSRVFTIDLTKADKNGKPEHQYFARGYSSSEIVAATSAEGFETVAFVDFMHVYLADAKNVSPSKPVWSRPGNATAGLARLSLDGGHDVSFSADGKKLFWLLGPYLHSLEISKISKCDSFIANDTMFFGYECTTSLLEVQEIKVEYETDVERLKHEARGASGCLLGDKACLESSDVYVITNATLLTMDKGYLNGDYIVDGAVVIKGGVIDQVGPAVTIDIPKGSTVVDAEGGYVIPGLIDVHAHWGGMSTSHPARSWEMEAFLAYGVTTLHNPSSDNVLGYTERGRVERGLMHGSRIFHTGVVIYGGGYPGLHSDIVNLKDAYATLIRIKAEGGPASFSYKNYNLPSRASRQRLITAARNLSMIAVPEGGMNYDWDLTYIIDGMATIEHALPIPQLYDDVLTLYAESGTGASPTHLVNYGGAWGEQLLWARNPPAYDQKLRNYVRHDMLERLSETTFRPKDSFQLYNTSASINKLVQRGLRAHIGAHGEPPIGYNYHGEMWLFQLGGMDSYKILQCATSFAAETLGLDSSVGSLKRGKLADIVVYPPGANLLANLTNVSQDPRLVIRGGRVWEAATMDQVWPTKVKRPLGPPLNP
ncbi:composite domain of metallo-dependent hydrolase [Sistotremastrum suecicum HHB10207 ss-3]|uniref:Composite domain of metallo-dependent hydrolase n=1 Tax=Sistotremastrum suecicum HHB10207 ss-3 TaxID=1314776 RepID=A0A166IZM3_9AGAM|nr:composite domain of metallo-dependent hydrolase [Sistotremastrum suecicum HHB10207 ss-3]